MSRAYMKNSSCEMTTTVTHSDHIILSSVHSSEDVFNNYCHCRKEKFNSMWKGGRLYQIMNEVDGWMDRFEELVVVIEVWEFIPDEKNESSN